MRNKLYPKLKEVIMQLKLIETSFNLKPHLSISLANHLPSDLSLRSFIKYVEGKLSELERISDDLNALAMLSIQV
jgi:hypothetical protein